MKAEINEKGTLLVFAESETESYAINQWELINRDGCTTQFKTKCTYDSLILIPYCKKKITLFRKLWIKIKLLIYK
jgi:hypothetical protein